MVKLNKSDLIFSGNAKADAWSRISTAFPADLSGDNGLLSLSSSVWDTYSAAEQNFWRSVAHSDSNGISAAVSSDGINKLMKSVDLFKNWSAIALPGTFKAYDVIWEESDSQWVIVGDNTTQGIITTPDLINLTLRSTGATARIWRAVAKSVGLGIYAVVPHTGTTLMYSTDAAVTWNPGFYASSGVINDVAASDTELIAVYESTINANKALVSVNGSAWNASPLGAGTWKSIDYSSAQNTYLAVGTNVSSYTNNAGVGWNNIAMPAGTWERVKYVAWLSHWVATSSDGKIAVMPSDLSGWTLITAPQINPWRGIAVSETNKVIAAVASDGDNRVMRTPDILHGYASPSPEYVGSNIRGTIEFKQLNSNAGVDNFFFAHANSIGHEPGESSVAVISNLNGSQFDINVNPWKSDVLDDSNAEQFGIYESTHLPKYRYTYNLVNGSYRQLLQYFDYVTNEWVTLTDLWSVLGAKKYDASQKTIYFGASSTEYVLGDVSEHVVDSVRTIYVDFPLSEILNDSIGNYRATYENGIWQNYCNVFANNATTYVNDITPNISIINGTHPFGSVNSKSLSVSLASLPNQIFKYGYIFDDPSKRNLKVTLPFLIPGNLVNDLDLKVGIKISNLQTGDNYEFNFDPLDGGTPFTIFYNGAPIETGAPFVLPADALFVGNQWYYLQFEMVQGVGSNTLNARAARTPASFASNQYYGISDSGDGGNPNAATVHDPGGGYQAPYYVQITYDSNNNTTLRNSELDIVWYS